MNQDKSIKIGVSGLFINDSHILLIQRAHAPFRKSWSLPGGKVEYGETVRHAFQREMQEEVGLLVAGDEPIFTEQIFPGGHFIIFTFVVYLETVNVVCGSDADAYCWLQREELSSLPTTPGLPHYIEYVLEHATSHK